MQLQQTKALAAGVWVSAMAAIGIATSVASPTSWAALALLTVIPPVILWRFWNAPDPSMSESIRKAIR